MSISSLPWTKKEKESIDLHVIDDVLLVFTSSLSFALANNYLKLKGFPRDENYGNTYEECIHYLNKGRAVGILMYWKDFCLYTQPDSVSGGNLVIEVDDDWGPPCLT